ncbi:MAG: phosphotransferase [bacterium]|nr:phosphotransferase [bacterium]
MNKKRQKHDPRPGYWTDPSGLTLIRKTADSRIYIAKGDDEYIIKEYFIPGIAENEYKILCSLKKNNYKYIPGVFLREKGNRTFLIEKAIKGDPIKLETAGPDDLDLLCRSLAGLHRIRQTGKKKLGGFLNKGLSIVKKGLDEIKSCMETLSFKDLRKLHMRLKRYFHTFENLPLLRKIKHRKIRYSMVHGTLQTGHLIRQKNRIYLIDWESGGFGDPLYDLACLLKQLTAKNRKLFLKTYQNTLNVTDDPASSRIQIYQLLSLFIKTASAMINLMTYRPFAYYNALYDTAQKNSLIHDLEMIRKGLGVFQLPRSR